MHGHFLILDLVHKLIYLYLVKAPLMGNGNCNVVPGLVECHEDLMVDFACGELRKTKRVYLIKKEHSNEYTFNHKVLSGAF